MKPYLFLLLLMPILAMGQDTANSALEGQKNCRFTHMSYFFASDRDSFQTIVGKDTVYTNNPYGAAGVVMMLQLWKDYAKECYYDSTRHEIRANAWQADAVIFYTYGREPTFPGFMEWIEKRLKP